MGAIAAGHDPDPWQELGARIGQAFQIADDLMDVVCADQDMGKPAGQDAKNDRPSAVSEYGVDGAKIVERHPWWGHCLNSVLPGEAELAKMVQLQSTRLMSVDRQATHSDQ